MLTPIVRRSLDCLQNCVMTILGAYTDGYPVCFCLSWNFAYQKSNDQVLGKQISNGGLEIIPNTERLFGAVFQPESDENFERFCERLESHVRERRMPMLYLDSFFCPWYPVYRKLHREHYCIVTGLTEEGDYLCLDPILEKSDVVLEKRELQNCFDHYILVTFPQPINVDTSPACLYALAMEGVERYIQCGCAAQMRAFAEDFYESFDYKKEFQDLETYFFDVELFKQLSYVAGGRELYGEYIRFLACRDPAAPLLCYAQRLEAVASRWSVIKGILTKSYYAHFDDKVKKRIFTHIQNIAEEEDSLSHDLFTYLKHRGREAHDFD